MFKYFSAVFVLVACLLMNATFSVGPVCASSIGPAGSTVTANPPYLGVGGNNFGPAWALTIPPLTGWTQINSPTFDTTNGYPYISMPANGGTSRLIGITRAVPTAPASLIFLLGHDASGQTTTVCGNTNVTACTYAWGYSDGTKYSVFDFGFNNAVLTPTLDHYATAATTNPVQTQNNTGISYSELVYRNPSWLKLCDDNTTIHWYFSLDKFHWKQIYSEARTSFLTAVSNVFFGANDNNGAVEVGIFSYETTGSCP